MTTLSKKCDRHRQRLMYSNPTDFKCINDFACRPLRSTPFSGPTLNQGRFGPQRGVFGDGVLWPQR